MDRRMLLSSTGATLFSIISGCVDDTTAESPTEGDDHGGDEPDSNDGDGGENGTTPDFERHVSIVDGDTVPDEAPIEFNLVVVDDTVTADGTAFLELTTTNVSNSEITVHPYYKGRSAADGRSGIVLYSLDAADSPTKEHTPDCIDSPESTRDHVDFTMEASTSHTLQPKESATDEYIIVDDPSLTGCFPPGAYRFEKEHSFETGEEEIQFTWGFTIKITEEPAKRSHSIYVENRTSRALCTHVLVDGDGSAIDDNYLVTPEKVVRFRDVLTGDSATITIGTDEHDKQIDWTSGDCPHEGGYSRSVEIRIDDDGIEYSIDECDAIAAGPYDEVVDATDAENCDSPTAD